MKTPKWEAKTGRSCWRGGRAEGEGRGVGAYRVFKSTGAFLSESRGKSKMRFIHWSLKVSVLYLCMSFSSNGIWTLFCIEWFPESHVLHPHGIFKEIFAQAVHMSVSCNVNPSENNHGWKCKKCCATLFFGIRSLEITNILEFGFSPFPFLFDLLSKRNNIFFFWNRSCISQYIGTSVKCTGLVQNNIFFWKGNCTEFFWSHWPTMQWQDGNLSFFLTGHCSPPSTEALSACSPLIVLWVTAPLSCSSKASPLSQLPENFFSHPL